MKDIICAVFIFGSDHHTAFLASQCICIQSRIIAYICSNIAAFGNNSYLKFFRYIICTIQH